MYRQSLTKSSWQIVKTKSYLVGCLTLLVGLVAGSHAAIADIEQLQRSKIGGGTLDGKIVAPSTVNTNTINTNNQTPSSFGQYILKNRDDVLMPTNTGGLKPMKVPTPGRHDLNLPTIIRH